MCASKDFLRESRSGASNANARNHRHKEAALIPRRSCACMHVQIRIAALAKGALPRVQSVQNAFGNYICIRGMRRVYFVNGKRFVLTHICAYTCNSVMMTKCMRCV